MNNQLPGEIVDFTRRIVDSCGLYSASIFLCDRTGDKPRLSYLFNHNITEETKERYEHNAIFCDDPFTHPDIQEREDLSAYDGLLLANDGRLHSEQDPSRYWRFMYDHEVEVVGASTRRLMPGLYSTIGFHCRKNDKRRKDVAIQRVDMLARRLQDMASGEMLRHILNRANGLNSFQAGYFERSDMASAGVLSKLSPREVEIANLVCQGRQNKEIAYLTNLSEHTVENHLRRIYGKLSIHNRSALVAAMVAESKGLH